MAKDILLDEEDDLLIVNGDLVIGDSEEQEVGLILRTNQGDWRQSPLTGFGVARRTRTEISRTQFERDLSTQLLMDGFDDCDVTLTEEGQLSIKAKRHG
ncbi:hypothetical protein SAMN02745146_0102 [Hymenobacter daecheongensis DSM 21074]|uniref:Uncharacterized protein n=1 Tax=Hymenobacter daecheongensis DSM 21074 TaxID=1121955 RepID=A0A1M6LYU2_9BACT|nr:hypothetical protein [Hymenobacter daecheongensis]SHJ76223.1 hypothetical protein SAMN02745146_0102 [Hymenobacter daecheongensis DSM 21074]